MTGANALSTETPDLTADVARARPTMTTPAERGDLGDVKLTRHREASAMIAAPAEQIFARLDDQTRLAEHMGRPSMMMGGGRMTYAFDDGRGRAVGSHIRMGGKAFGLDLDLDEVVTERDPPWRKVWRTVGAPRLVIIGAYAMGFEIAPSPGGSRLTVWIDYALPGRGMDTRPGGRLRSLVRRTDGERRRHTPGETTVSDTNRDRTLLSPSAAVVTDAGLRAFMLGIYRKLALGLVVSGAVAWTVGNVPAVSSLLLRFSGGQLAGYTLLGMLVLFSPLILMLASGFVMRTPTAAGTGLLYWAIVALLGASLGTLFFVYTGGSLASTFFVTAAAFGGLSLWGYTTKRSLTGFGTFLSMGLIGLLVAMVVNLFLRSPLLYFVTNLAGVLIFSGLIAWDTKRLALVYDKVGGDAAAAAVATNFGALSLFLDFVNLFQFLLALTGQRRR